MKEATFLMEPKYKKIEKYFIDQINSGNYKIGDQLPPEKKIANETGYSRMTINKALSNLEKKGYITRISGRGTFVKAKKTIRMVNDDSSIFDLIQNQEMKSSSTLLSYERINSYDNVFLKDGLELSESAQIHHIVRLREANDEPVALTDDYLIADLIENIDLNLLNQSLYAYLTRLKLPIIRNYVEINAVKASEEQIKLLKLSDNFLLKTVASVDTITNNNNRKRLGLLCSYYNPNMYTYRFSDNDYE
ncbi:MULTISPECIES: GntR family transcriptional regulator [Liquorilactobacillus]